MYIPIGNFDHFTGKQKKSKISNTGEAMPTKTDLHAFHNHLYLHEFSSQFYFLIPMDRKGILAVLMTKKMSKIPKTSEATPTKIGLHAFHSYLYLHEFLEPILFLTTMDY